MHEIFQYNAGYVKYERLFEHMCRSRHVQAIVSNATAINSGPGFWWPSGERTRAGRRTWNATEIGVEWRRPVWRTPASLGHRVNRLLEPEAWFYSIH